ncbi:AraC family transcriptional regulator [Herbaspirillum sp. RV1423]|uniref:AraC family transcriptional regulator n=1 Tax=Herbaspirillum sp. RV1423 TaxID=1443993 RepID=UPI000686BD56|nr:AraC family transcriptional regulator [Herbaspirillum sp. RV1423]
MKTPAANPAEPAASDPLAQLRAQVATHFDGVPPGQRDVHTAIPYLSFIRLSQPTALNRGMLEPSMCLVVQGRKKILIGNSVSHYGVGAYVLSAIDLPVSGQIVEASAELPYYGVRIELDPREIAALIIELDIAAPPKRTSRVGAYVDESDSELQQAFLRLVALLKTPRDIPAMSRILKQEIMYRLIAAKNGDVLYHTVLAHYQEKGVNDAIRWIKENYAQPMSIEQLAKQVRMSVSTLHHRFKAATVMSPLQYQKQTRLLEARRMLMTGSMEAATVGYRVGYESPSQFSREYRRLFGASPLQDVEFLKQHIVET